jgi:transcriptional regulator with XRE-family HTH domain
MIIGNQLRALRKQQSLTQGDIEKRSGLWQCYVSRVENGHKVPSIETLEKWARSLNVPLYQLFYEGKDSRAAEPLKTEKSHLWGSDGKDAHYLNELRRSLSRTRERDRELLLQMARKLARGTNASGKLASRNSWTSPSPTSPKHS